MTTSEAFVEAPAAQVVDSLFGIMGSAFMDAMDVFAPAGIRMFPVVHEQRAGHLADGHARAVDLQLNQRKTCAIEIMCTREPGDPVRRDALARPVRLLKTSKDCV